MEKGSQNKYAGPFLFSLSLCFIVDAGKPFTNQKVFPFHGKKNIKQAFISLFNHLHMENNRHTFASHHRTSVRPCLSYKLQTIHRTPLQKGPQKIKNNERLVHI